MTKKTELKDGQRVWTRESTEIILEGYQPQHLEDYWYRLGVVFRGGLKEAGFSEPRTMLENKISLTLQTKEWFCPIHLLRLDDGHIVFLFALEKYSTIDLIYLWDFIRQSWSQRMSES